jgi:hypothetical protein
MVLFFAVGGNVMAVVVDAGFQGAGIAVFTFVVGHATTFDGHVVTAEVWHTQVPGTEVIVNAAHVVQAAAWLYREQTMLILHVADIVCAGVLVVAVLVVQATIERQIMGADAA